MGLGCFPLETNVWLILFPKILLGLYMLLKNGCIPPTHGLSINTNIHHPLLTQNPPSRCSFSFSCALNDPMARPKILHLSYFRHLTRVGFASPLTPHLPIFTPKGQKRGFFARNQLTTFDRTFIKPVLFSKPFIFRYEERGKRGV